MSAQVPVASANGAGAHATPAYSGPAHSTADLQALLIVIVAEKTGYPQEMLTPTMELEADLGIDSIKRVEILSAMRERAPGLPEVKPAELAALRTLGEIANYMSAQVPVASANGAGAHAPAQVAAASGGPSTADLQALLIVIVAEKTGYPQEMLAPTMELEADLGIDSIKRVEILSAMRERAPGLPEVKPAELAALRTLGEIANYMGAHAGASNGSSANGNTSNGTTNGAAHGKHLAPAIKRFAVRSVPAAAAGLAMPGILKAAQLVITQDGGGVAEALQALLQAVGVRAAVVTEVPANADAVVFLGGLRKVATEEAALAVNREAFAAARTVAKAFSTKGGAWITVQDTFAPNAAWLGIAALSRTAAREWPLASVKAINCELGGRAVQAVAQALLNELLQGGTTLDVGLAADGARSTLMLAETEAQASAPLKLDENSVVVVSGGARGVTAACVIALAHARRCKIVLLGRSPLNLQDAAKFAGCKTEAELKRTLIAEAQASGSMPKPADVARHVSQILATREIQATQDAIVQAGGQCKYVATDVQDATAVASALAGVRAEWGPIRAVVHGAGVLADKLLGEKTDEQFGRVFDTKVLGLRALLDATSEDPLTALCLFSSIAARTGNVGQADYAMANEVLNMVAVSEQQRRGRACAVRSIGWGPWEGGMVTPSLKTHFEHMGVALIPLDVGARMFVTELECGTSDTVLVVSGPAGTGPLGSDRTSSESSVELRVQRESQAFLADHRVAGAVVAPVVMVLEWLTRAARDAYPQLHVAAVRNLKVLRGIKLEGYDSAVGDCFKIRLVAQPAAETPAAGVALTLSVELRGKNDALHYSAMVDMTKAGAEATLAGKAARTVGTLEAWRHGPIYDGTVLFHGPKFQAIANVDGVWSTGLSGTLFGALDLGFASGSTPEAADTWCTDPATLDGALQLAVLYARHMLNGAALPMALGGFRSHMTGLTRGPIVAFVHLKDRRDARLVCDVTLIDAAGMVVAELEALEVVLRPDVVLAGAGRESAPQATQS
jgi:acyl carrier protein